MVRYPHICMLISYDEPTQDSDGNISATETETETACRVEPQTQALQVESDGDYIEVSNKVFCPVSDSVGVDKIRYNDTEYPVLRLWKYQTHCEIWV